MTRMIKYIVSQTICLMTLECGELQNISVCP